MMRMGKESPTLILVALVVKLQGGVSQEIGLAVLLPSIVLGNVIANTLIKSLRVQIPSPNQINKGDGNGRRNLRDGVRLRQLRRGNNC